MWIGVLKRRTNLTEITSKMFWGRAEQTEQPNSEKLKKNFFFGVWPFEHYVLVLETIEKLTVESDRCFVCGWRFISFLAVIILIFKVLHLLYNEWVLHTPILNYFFFGNRKKARCVMWKKNGFGLSKNDLAVSEQGFLTEKKTNNTLTSFIYFRVALNGNTLLKVDGERLQHRIKVFGNTFQ